MNENQWVSSWQSASKWKKRALFLFSPVDLLHGEYFFPLCRGNKIHCCQVQFICVESGRVEGVGLCHLRVIMPLHLYKTQVILTARGSKEIISTSSACPSPALVAQECFQNTTEMGLYHQGVMQCLFCSTYSWRTLWGPIGQRSAMVKSAAQSGVNSGHVP